MNKNNESALSIDNVAEYIELLNEATRKTQELYELQKKTNKIEFLTIEDVQNSLGICEKTAKKLFNDPEFPSNNYGREKTIMASEFIKFFSVKRNKKNSAFWNN